MLAVALADQFTEVPLRVPWAVPLTFRSPAHVALKLPFALVPVWSVAFHLKFVQEDGDGMILVDADVHVPIKAFAGLVLVGAVMVLV